MGKEIYELSLDAGDTWKQINQESFLNHLALFPVGKSKEYMVGRLIGGETLMTGVMGLRLSFVDTVR
jgi:hypothetical protein